MDVHVFTNNNSFSQTIIHVTGVKIEDGVLKVKTHDSTFNYPLVNVQCWREMNPAG